MADALAKALKKISSEGGFTPFHQPVHEDHNERVRIMAERQAAGLDIWTGKPLTPDEDETEE